jgi:hypothetical protein
MKAVKFIYQNQEVEFEVEKNDVMVNATEMAKIFGKDVPDFLILKQTKEFINECLKNQNSGFLGIENQDGLFISKQKSGTWMHRVLALKFAAWLDPAFDLWVFMTIDKLINAHFQEQRDALVEKLSAKHKKEIKKQEIIEKYADIPEIAEYFELEKTEKEANKKRMASIRDQVKQLSIGFTF